MRRALSYLFLSVFALTTHLYGQADTGQDVDILGLANLERIECSIVPIVRASEHTNEFEIDKEHQEHGTGLHDSLELGTSTNWSGYAAVTNFTSPTPGSVNAVYGAWMIPPLNPSTGNTYCATWVGIDGYASGTVEQIGTAQEWINGKQVNYAWFEMYPNPSFQIAGFPVYPNDVIVASVLYQGNNIFQLTMANYTRNVYTVVPTAYTQSAFAQRSSAEWIMEAPASTQGVLPLAHFNPTPFFNCYATINGITGGISSPYWMTDSIIMKKTNGLFKALPSGLLNNGTGFLVNWYHE